MSVELLKLIIFFIIFYIGSKSVLNKYIVNNLAQITYI